MSEYPVGSLMVDRIEDLYAYVGSPLGQSSVVHLTQAMFDQFALLTGADHWSHVDVERSARGPFGSTIAPGMLVLSLGTPMLRKMYQIRSVTKALHFGFDRVRFVAPVPVESELYIEAVIEKLENSRGGTRIHHQVEFFARRGGQAVSAAVARSISKVTE